MEESLNPETSGKIGKSSRLLAGQPSLRLCGLAAESDPLKRGEPMSMTRRGREADSSLRSLSEVVSIGCQEQTSSDPAYSWYSPHLVSDLFRSEGAFL